MEETRNINGKLLRCGYTTGSCAAAAAKAAALMLLSGRAVDAVALETPRGPALSLEILDAETGPDFARCAVRKDAGDDPDITDGILVYAELRKIPAGLVIEGGEGVGRVAKPGLDQPVGAAAINSTPRRMIAEAMAAVSQAYGYGGGFSVVISLPGGRELARRTFNPRLGIEGGLSVIGTTGIVEPMSHQALIDTVRLEIRQLALSGRRELLLTPGNYGEAFARDILGLSLRSHVSCANLIGDALDAAAEAGFRSILLVGHIGKLVKLGIGMTNTHSSAGDGRLETLVACALAAGAGLPLLQALLDCVSTEAALDLLASAGVLAGTMQVLGERIDVCLARRVPAEVRAGCLCFTGRGGAAVTVAESANAAELLEMWREKG